MPDTTAVCAYLEAIPDFLFKRLIDRCEDMKRALDRLTFEGHERLREEFPHINWFEALLIVIDSWKKSGRRPTRYDLLAELIE